MTPTSLQNLSLENKKSGTFHPADAWREQFLYKLPFLGMSGATDTFEWNTAEDFSADGLPPFVLRGATKNMPATDTRLNAVAFQRLSEHLELDTYDSISGRMCDNTEVQARGLKLKMLRTLSQVAISGIASPNPLGLAHLSIGNVFGASNNAINGGFMTLQDIYRAMYAVCVTDDEMGKGGADYAICHPKTLRELMGLVDTNSRSEGFTWVYDEDLGVDVPKFRGVIWLIGQVPTNETKGTGTNLTSVYFVKLKGPTGLKMLYAKPPQQVELDRKWGFYQYPIPINQTKNRKGLCMEGVYALLSPEGNYGVSRLNGIKPTQFAL